MKKIILLFTFVLTTLLSASAQFGQGGPKFSFSSADPCTDEEFCISVTVEDFTDLTSVKFPIKWDPSVIEFVRVDGLNLAGLTTDDFDVTRTDEGLLLLDWIFQDCATASSAITLMDSVAIFEICFRAVSTYGAATTVEVINDSDLTNDPTPIDVKRLGVCTQNIGLRLGRGIVSTCVRPLNLVASSTSGNPGELVCVDVSVDGFDELIGMQFSMNWDPEILQFADVIPTENLRNLNVSDFGTPDNVNIGPGRLTVSWAYLDPNDLGESLADGTSIFQVCFRVVGECEQTTPFEFTSDPTRIEAFNALNDSVTIPVTVAPGLFEAGACEPEGLQLAISCGDSVSLNQEVCASVSAVAELNDVDEIEYLMEWNPNILEFLEVRNRNQMVIPGLNASDFDESNVRNGILGLEWDAANNSFAADISPGDQLYDVCFTVVGLGGDSPVRINTSSDRVTLINSGRNLGVFPSNCAVEVRQPDEVRITISENRGVPNDIVCVDVTAGNFVDVTSLQFPLGWEPADLEFINVQNVNPLFDASDINTSFAASGGLQFDWNGDGTPQNLPEGTPLFTACFRVVGTPPGELGQQENCIPITMTGILEAEAVTIESNGSNVGILSDPGEICILNPDGFFVVIDDINSYQDDTLCVPIDVRGFNNITSTQFTLNWSPALLEFQEVRLNDNPLNLQEGVSLGTNAGDVGLIEVDWENQAGVSLPDDTPIFEVCYAVVGEPDTCADITVEFDPVPAVTTLTGAGSIFPIGGNVCIRDTIIILGANISPVSCPGGNDGSIELMVKDYDPEANPQTIFFNWETQPQQFNQEAINLREGEVVVSVFTNTIPAVIVRDTFMIPLTDDLPRSDAGQDVVFECDGPAFLITAGDSTSVGDEYAYQWTTFGGVLAGTTDRRSVPVQAPGTYILEVTNTQTGCSSTDTVEVLDPPTPLADAGEPFTFTCDETEFRLDGSGSETDGMRYQWLEFNGGLIAPGEETTLNPRILAAGTFVLEVIDTVTQCSSMDTVEIANSAIFPNAFAGEPVELGCDGSTVQLDGSGSENLQDVTYSWQDLEGNVLSSQVTVEVDSIGSYILTVQDIETGCESFDTTQVVPSPDFPTVSAGEDDALDCDNETVVLNASVSNATDFSVTWTSPDSGMLAAGTDTLLQPTVMTAGTFILSVTNNASGCTSTDTAVVIDNIIRPDVDAGMGGTLTCVDSSLILSGNAVIAPDSLRYTWVLDGQTVAIDTLSVEVNQGGTYELQVEDLTSGCTNSDTVVVVDATAGPVYRLDQFPALTCNDPTVTINGELLPAEGDYSIQWSVPQGSTGEIISGGNTRNPVVGRAGLYEVSLLDNATGCSSTRPVEVVADTTAPVADAGMDMNLTCAVDSVVLNGIGSGTGTNITYEWNSVNNGVNPEASTDLQPVVRVADTYTLTVRDTSNGCFAIDSVTVSELTNPPAISIAEPATVSCEIPNVQLDATGSDQEGNFDVQWTALDGQAAPQVGADPYVATVSAGGNYQLILTNLGTGCENTQVVSVLEDRVAPTATAITPATLTCPGTAVTLSGSGSSTGTIYTYTWTTLSGDETITDAQTLSPSVDAAGEYQLEVTNTNNGCSATATVIVERDARLVDADAGEDQTSCTEDGMLFAGQPAEATGRWTSIDDDGIDLATDANTGVSGLEVGENQFVWTLSLPDCPNYSADTVTVTREEAPIAGNDQVTLDVGELNRSINVIANDQYRPGANLSISIISDPVLGSIGTIANGQVDFQVNGGLSGEDEFTYQVCIEQCVELCDSAIVKVTIPFDPTFEVDAPNGITPNGDGLNDRLIFEVLENAPEQFEDNEIVIFNRWGDIVYEAAPYMNEWSGQNSGGNELPAGTYYYILRLNINEGQIIRGDVTIVR
mgnify:CR=1 FL=1